MRLVTISVRAGSMARDLLRCGEQGDDTAIAAGKSIVVLRRGIEQQSIPAKRGVGVVSAGFELNVDLDKLARKLEVLQPWERATP
jgi:hypothetical protein